MTNSATILLVEDDKFMLEGIRDLLQEAEDIGYRIQILMAENGQIGLDIMRTHPPDLIISDVNMPYMDGNQFLQHVRTNREWLHIPIIFLTAKGKEEDIHKAKTSGVDLYITKPFNSEELKELVKSQLDRSFQKQITRQQNIDSLKRDILQILNHELNTPLTYVTAYSEMLIDNIATFESSSDFQDYLRGIQVGCMRLSRLVEDFIQVIELRTGEAESKYRQYAEPIGDIADLIWEAVHTSQRRSEPNRVHIHFNLGEHLPPVMGYRKNLVTVFERLIDNAIKFTFSHKGSEGNVTISTSIEEGHLYIAISDEGAGFPRHIQHRLFELFFQYNRATHEQQGTGTGLTIAKELLALHEGVIKIDSQEGESSTFRVILPIYDPQRPSKLPDENAPIVANILIVEDDHHLLSGLQELLELYTGKYKFNVFTAVNGQNGLEVLAENRPHLIISDIMMPQMGGYEFLEQVRQNPDLIQIPFIFLTAKGERRDIVDGLVRGVEEYITKPYDSDVLIDLVVAQLDKHFQMQSVLSKSFEILRRNILDLMSPDFQQPLSTVARYSENLADQLTNAETDMELKRSLKGIQEGSSHLAQLVEDFISLAELATGEAAKAHKMLAQPIYDLDVLVHEVSHLCAYKAKELGIQVHYTSSGDIPVVYGVSTRLLDCLEQLVEIGITHYPEAVGKRMDLSTRYEGEEVCLKVHFSHPLSEADLHDMQVLLVGSNQEKIELSGPNSTLKIIQGQIRLHNGRMTLHNDETAGFSLSIHLPVYTEPTAV